MKYGSIAICSHSEAPQRIANVRAVISIWDKNGVSVAYADGVPELSLAFNDIDYAPDDFDSPTCEHLMSALNFARAHAVEALMVCCHAGVSRSTAVALAIIADRLEPGDERNAVDALLLLRPQAKVNLLLLDYADRILMRDGRLVEAWFSFENAKPEFAIWRRRKHLLGKFGGSVGATDSRLLGR